MKKSKLFVVLSLVLIVAGLAVFGFMGFNQTVDKKECFEAKITIDQSFDDAKATLVSASKAYLDENNIKAADYAVQKLEDGNVFVYKFNKDVKLDTDAFAKYVHSRRYHP